MSCTGFLTYASFSKGGRGGWQVGQAEGLNQKEVDELIAWTPTRIDTGQAIPKYPSNAEVAQFPRRTAWLDAPWGSGDKVLFYSTPAGEDSSGRQGNVFSQVYVFRSREAVRNRPTDLLESPDFAQVFGAVAVNTQTVSLADAKVAAGPYADASGLVDWLYGSTEDAESVLRGERRRTALLQVMDAIEENPSVAICCAPADAAKWLAALGLSLAAANAAALSWSTLERARFLDQPRAKGLKIVCLPAADYAEAKQLSGWTALQVEQPVQPVVSVSGQPRSAWAQLAQLVLADKQHFLAATKQQVDLQDSRRGWMFANYLSQYPKLTEQLTGPARQIVDEAGSVIGKRAAEAVSAAGKQHFADKQHPSADSWAVPEQNPFANASNVGQASQDTAAGPWGSEPVVHENPFDNPYANPYESASASVDVPDPLAIWWELGEVLRLASPASQTDGPWLDAAQHSVLVFVVANAAQAALSKQMELLEAINELPWEHTEQLPEDTIVELAKSVTHYVHKAQIDSLLQQSKLSSGLHRIVLECDKTIRSNS